MKFALISGFLGIAFAGSLLAQAPNPCWQNDTLHLLVLGSSTAAGAGASTADSTWVNRFRRYWQGYNPANRLTNLAVGGFSTWRILDTGYPTPAGRPPVDTNRNISAALALNPQAIIVNLPSNDAAIGTGLNQQMANFHRLDSLSRAAGLAFYLCTTQPRNGSQSFKQVQTAVRDSILAAFGTRALDFWTGLADTSDGLSPHFDSGDGVHLNDAGHRLLFQRVQAAQLLAHLSQARPGYDLQAEEILLPEKVPCGKPNSSVGVVLRNVGRDSASAGTLFLQVFDRKSGQTTLRQRSLGGLRACSRDTQSFVFNTSAATDWQLLAWAVDSAALLRKSDSAPPLNWRTQALPVVQIQDTLVCPGDTFQVSAQSLPGDSLFWFRSAADSLPWHSGKSLAGKALRRSDTFYLQARRPPFYHLDSLQLTQASEVAWNGIMFDLVAGADTATVDSLSFISGSNGAMGLRFYTCSGSHRQHLSQPGAWQFWGRDSLAHAIDGHRYQLRPGPLRINPFDTVGVYLHAFPASRSLRYARGSGGLSTMRGAGLELRSGTGVAYQFGNTFFPRIFPGMVHYHYGTNPAGQCQSQTQSLILAVSDTLRLPDTLSWPVGQPFSFLAPAFSRYRWSTGDTTRLLQLPGGKVGDTLRIGLWVEDSLGCSSRDSLLLIFSVALDGQSPLELNWSIYPQPASGFLYIDFEPAQSGTLRLYDLRGRLLRKA